MACGFVFLHDLKARAAASTACVASSVLAPEALQILDEVPGETTSKVVDVVTSLPSIQRGL